LFLRPKTNHEDLADTSALFIRFRPNTVQTRRFGWENDGKLAALNRPYESINKGA
jgi:hypothetical protein